MNYNNNNRMQPRRGYTNGNNDYFYRNQNRNFNNPNGNFNRNYRRNTYYNRQRYNNNINDGYDNGGYDFVSRPPRMFNGNSRNSSVPRQQRKNRPRQIRLNDFMPAGIRDASPNAQNLPEDFNLLNSDPETTSRPVTPVNALPQRQNFTTMPNNTTQPFIVNNGNQKQQQQQRPNGQQNRKGQSTTSSYRRRQRRNRQQQDRNKMYNNNRFAVFNQQDDLTDMESNYGDQNDNAAVAVPLNNNSKQNTMKKKKRRLYLEPERIMRHMQDKSSITISGRGNQAYVLATISIYDEWVRYNYELQVWQVYLNMGTENKHWAKEVVQRTKKRDDETCTRFIQKKINQLSVKIAQASAAISNMQIQLSTYWNHTLVGTAPTTTSSSTSTTNNNRARDNVDRLERSILNYLQHCTQHVKKMAETKIKLARAQMEEFKALEDFEQIATPLQWNIHLAMKPKMKTWSTKNKNYRTAVKRVEYDLPPKFISKVDFSFKLDESILSQEEAQGLYNQMRQLTKEFRTQAMTLYVQTCTREHELLTNQITQIMNGFPQENDDGFDCEPGFAAFKHYNELREKRSNLEADQSIYFLDEQRVEGSESNNQEEIVTAPTLTRSLGEDFLLQQ
ncbi:unnamed protein product [Adineta ricciae]|uniref:Uncharacterized protein n=1 Tax=Adineta ricciae TaxID=249248 RepID=A0A816DEU0_ADIRI|nr:unnamed protein product [Adineta ricciae]